MGKVLHITDWDEHYEVDSKGRSWVRGKAKRKGGLSFVRWYVLGPSNDNQAYAEVAEYVAEHYGPDAWAVCFGLFAKLVEIAANQQAGYRGYLLGRGHSPISKTAMQRIICFPETQIEKALTILLSEGVGWVEWVDYPELSGHVRNCPDTSGTVRNPLIKPNPNPNSKQSNTTERGKALGIAAPSPSDSDSDDGKPPPPETGKELSEQDEWIVPETAAMKFMILAMLPTSSMTEKKLRDEKACWLSYFTAVNTTHRPVQFMELAFAKGREVAADKTVRPSRRASVLNTWFRQKLTREGAGMGLDMEVTK